MANSATEVMLEAPFLEEAPWPKTVMVGGVCRMSHHHAFMMFAAMAVLGQLGVNIVLPLFANASVRFARGSKKQRYGAHFKVVRCVGRAGCSWTVHDTDLWILRMLRPLRTKELRSRLIEI